MKKLLLTLACLFASMQVASAFDLDTVWVKQLRPMKCHLAAFSSDTNKIVAVIDSTIYYLDIHNGSIIDSFQKAPDFIAEQIYMSFNGKRFSARLNTGAVVIWDSATKSIIKIFDTHSNYVVTACGFSPDGKYAVCGAWVKNINPQLPDTKRLLIYDLDADTIVKWKDTYYGPYSYFAYSPDGNSFVVSYGAFPNYPGYLVKYNTNKWDLTDTILDYDSRDIFTYLSYSSDGKYLAGAKNPSNNAASYVWDMTKNEIYKSYPQSKLNGFYSKVYFSSNNQLLLFGSGYPFLNGKPNNQIWDFMSDTSIFRFSSYSNATFEYNKSTGLMLIANTFEIYLFSPNWQPSTVFEPTEKSDDISIVQENKTLIVKSKDFDLQKIEIFDVMGSLVLSKTADSEEIAVSMQGLQSGIYFVKVQTARQVFVRKVLVVE
ncbi:MAG: T9SS type A sorting domain-containing protein [Bacteroidota bacterium]